MKKIGFVLGNRMDSLDKSVKELTSKLEEK